MTSNESVNSLKVNATIVGPGPALPWEIVAHILHQLDDDSTLALLYDIQHYFTSNVDKKKKTYVCSPSLTRSTQTTSCFAILVKKIINNNKIIKFTTVRNFSGSDDASINWPPPRHPSSFWDSLQKRQFLYVDYITFSSLNSFKLVLSPEFVAFGNKILFSAPRLVSVFLFVPRGPTSPNSTFPHHSLVDQLKLPSSLQSLQIECAHTSACAETNHRWSAIAKALPHLTKLSILGALNSIIAKYQIKLTVIDHQALVNLRRPKSNYFPNYEHYDSDTRTKLLYTYLIWTIFNG